MAQGETVSTRLSQGRTQFLGVSFDCLSQAQVIAQLHKRGPLDDFGYVVTPNVDHVVRLANRPSDVAYYEKAWLCLCDSRPLQLLSGTVARPLTHVTGSDLTKLIFDTVVQSDDTITLIVAREEVAHKLVARYPHLHFFWHVPPFGVAERPEALRDVVDFIVDHPARFTFIAIGSPQSEMIADQANATGLARGTAFCVGASLEFITGDRARAPAWMNRSGLEWLHRMATEPRRLWKRYVYAVPPLVALYWRELVGRQRR